MFYFKIYYFVLLHRLFKTIHEDNINQYFRTKSKKILRYKIMHKPLSMLNIRLLVCQPLFCFTFSLIKFRTCLRSSSSREFHGSSHELSKLFQDGWWKAGGWRKLFDCSVGVCWVLVILINKSEVLYTKYKTKLYKSS